MDIRKNFLKRAGMGVLIVAVLLLGSAVLWGDIRLMVDQQAQNGGLTLSIWDGATPLSSPSVIGSALPQASCDVPVLDWDSTLNSNLGGWVIFGSDSNGAMWSGTVACNAYSSSSIALPCTFTLKSGTPPGSSSCPPLASSSCLISTALWAPAPAPTPSPTPTPIPSPTPPPTAGCPTATSTFVYIPGGAPATGGGLGMSINNPQTISAYGEKHYFFCLSKAPTTSIQISMATEDWQTNEDMLVSNVSQPSCSQDPRINTSNLTPNLPPWYNINSGSTEMVLMHPPANQNLVYYVTVCSQTPTEGKFGLYWAAR